jgi:hypothetical protein
MYKDLTPFERKLGTFADRVEIIVGLEIGDKISPEAAYQQIKALMKELKKQRKQEKSTWESEVE